MTITRALIPKIKINETKHGSAAKPAIYVVEVRRKSESDGDPIAYLLIQREVQQRLDERDGSVFEASIEITYTEIVPKDSSWDVSKKGWFTACYSNLGNEPKVSLSATRPYNMGYVIVEMERLRGQRFGTYLMNEIVSWAKHWPDATILPIHLLDGQAYEGNKERRNRFYEQFGIEFDYVDHGKASGKSKSMYAAQLVNISSWTANIRELDLHGYMTFLLTERQKHSREISGLQTQLENNRRYVENVRAAPFRWAFEQRFPNFMGTVVKLVLLGLVAYSVVSAFR
jgi:GNAT superfamily N-acetyltransferase